jgi:hypothetical protein
MMYATRNCPVLAGESIGACDLRKKARIHLQDASGYLSPRRAAQESLLLAFGGPILWKRRPANPAISMIRIASLNSCAVLIRLR